MRKLLSTLAMGMAFLISTAQSESAASPWSIYFNLGGGYMQAGMQSPEGNLLTGRHSGGLAIGLGVGLERNVGPWRFAFGTRFIHSGTGLTVQYQRNVPSPRTFERTTSFEQLTLQPNLSIGYAINKFTITASAGMHSVINSVRSADTDLEWVKGFDAIQGYKQWQMFETIFDGTDRGWQSFAGLSLGRQLGENFRVNLDVAHYGLANMSKGSTYEIVVSESPGWSTTDPNPAMESETLRARAMTWFFGLSLQYHLAL